MRESIAELQVIRGILNEALQCLDEGMVTSNMDGYESLTRARERLINALARLMAVEKRLTQQMRRAA
jgi:hypothetical protein